MNRTYNLKVESWPRQVIDTGSGGTLQILAMGSSDLHLSSEPTGDAEQILTPGERTTVTSRTWLWAPGTGRCRVRVIEFNPEPVEAAA